MLAALGQFLLAVAAVSLARWPVGYATVWLASGVLLTAWTAGLVLSLRIAPGGGGCAAISPAASFSH